MNGLAPGLNLELSNLMVPKCDIVSADQDKAECQSHLNLCSWPALLTIQKIHIFKFDYSMGFCIWNIHMNGGYFISIVS
jgi:hypothetical protein